MSCIDLTNGAIMPGATLPDMFKSHLSSSSDFLKLAEFMHSRYTQYLIATLKGDTRISDIVSGWQHAQREFQSERTNLERELQKLRTDNQSLSQIKSSFTEMEHSNTLLKRQVRELEQLLVTTQQVAEAAKNTREIVASASLSIDVDSYSPTRTHSPSNPASSRSPVTTTGKSRKRSEANVASPVAGDSQVPPDKRAKRTEVRATEKVQETDALQDLIYGERDYMDPKIERPKSVMPVDPTQVQSMPQTATPSNAQELLQSIQHITSQPSIPATHTSPTPGQLIPNFTSPAKSTGDSSAQNMTLANLAQFNSDLPTLLGASGSNPGPSTSASLAPLPGLANGQDRLTAMDDQKLLDQLLNTSTGQAGGVQIPCNSRTIRSATGGTKYKEKYCKICGVFMTNEHNHMKIHSDERPFNLQSDNFSLQSNRHNKPLFQETTDYTLDQLPQNFRDLFSHCEGSKKYQCNLCSFENKRLRNITDHVAISHCGMPKLKCSGCTKEFNAHNTRLSHWSRKACNRGRTISTIREMTSCSWGSNFTLNFDE